MSRRPSGRAAAHAAIGVALAAFAATPATAQLTFSVEARGASMGVLDGLHALPITEGDLLGPATGGDPALGWLAPPHLVQTAGYGPPGWGLELFAHAACAGHPPGEPCAIEVDALSFGEDARLDDRPLAAPPRWRFSVDRFAAGVPGAPPDVASEAPSADASADVFGDLGLPHGPLGPGAAPAGNVDLVDGDGLASPSGAVLPALGLLEGYPFVGDADDVDALDLESDRTPRPTYFSLDAGFVDPWTGLPNASSAAAIGRVGGDVLVNTGDATPNVYAPAHLLGLDLAGPDTDDLDALSLVESGDGVFTPSQTPYDWLTHPERDQLLFSVRRGSAVIGRPDSITGLPIEPGDVLVPPVAGGVSPYPGLFLAAEALGLRTVRSGTTGVLGDELDALDILPAQPPGHPFCLGDGGGTPCPCGNDSAARAAEGCRHSGGFGVQLRGSGRASLAADTLRLSASGVPAGQPGLFFQGTLALAGGAGLPFGDGLRCAGGVVRRLAVRTAAEGSLRLGRGVPGDAPLSKLGAIGAAGETRTYQVWYRDPAPYCTPAGYDLSNGYAVTWVP